MSYLSTQPLQNTNYQKQIIKQPASPLIDPLVLERILFQQLSQRKTWQGVNAVNCGVPGTTTLDMNDRIRMFQNERDYAYACDKVFEVLKEMYETIEIKRADLQATIDSEMRKKRRVFIKGDEENENAGGAGTGVGLDKAVRCFDNKQYIKFKFQELLKNGKTAEYSEENIRKINSINFSNGPTTTRMEGSTHSYFKMLKSDSKLVRYILEINGLKITDRHDWNILWTNTHGMGAANVKAGAATTSYFYERLVPYQQKLNHFPCSNQITRKDRLAINMKKMQSKFSELYYNFIPETFVLPGEYLEFENAFYRKGFDYGIARSEFQQQASIKRNLWIVKPSGSSRGRGIYIVDDPKQIPQSNESLVVSRYIDNPLLLNGHKFDLRIYVLVTSYDPLRIYVYREGLVRFASEKYDISKAFMGPIQPSQQDNQNDQASKYSHLTNYSINKKNDKYIQNENADNDDCGFKWSFSALSDHFEQQGIDLNLMWSKIYDVIIKSLIAIEEQVKAQSKKANIHRTNCFELFGYDIILDNNLDPWLLEVNLSPSLAFDSPLDLKIKGNLLKDTFNLAGVTKPQYSKNDGGGRTSPIVDKEYLRTIEGSNYRKNTGMSQEDVLQILKSEGINKKVKNAMGKELNSEQIQYLISFAQLSSTQREMILDSLLEFQRCQNFVRIYPSKNTDFYDCFFTQKGKQTQQILYQSLHSEILPTLADFITGLKSPSILQPFLGLKFNLNLANTLMTPQSLNLQKLEDTSRQNTLIQEPDIIFTKKVNKTQTEAQQTNRRQTARDLSQSGKLTEENKQQDLVYQLIYEYFRRYEIKLQNSQREEAWLYNKQLAPIVFSRIIWGPLGVIMDHEFESMLAQRLPKVQLAKSREKENFAGGKILIGGKRSNEADEQMQRCFSNILFLGIVRNRMDNIRKYLARIAKQQSDGNENGLMKSSVYKTAFTSLKHPNFEDRSMKKNAVLPQLLKFQNQSNQEITEKLCDAIYKLTTNKKASSDLHTDFMKSLMPDDDDLYHLPTQFTFLSSLDPPSCLYIQDSNGRARFYFAQNSSLDPSSTTHNMLDLISFTNVQLLTTDQRSSLMQLQQLNNSTDTPYNQNNDMHQHQNLVMSYQSNEMSKLPVKPGENELEVRKSPMPQNKFMLLQDEVDLPEFDPRLQMRPSQRQQQLLKAKNEEYSMDSYQQGTSLQYSKRDNSSKRGHKNSYDPTAYGQSLTSQSSQQRLYNDSPEAKMKTFEKMMFNQKKRQNAQWRKIEPTNYFSGQSQQKSSEGKSPIISAASENTTVTSFFKVRQSNRSGQSRKFNAHAFIRDAGSGYQPHEPDKRSNLNNSTNTQKSASFDPQIKSPVVSPASYIAASTQNFNKNKIIMQHRINRDKQIEEMTVK